MTTPKATMKAVFPGTRYVILSATILVILITMASCKASETDLSDGQAGVLVERAFNESKVGVPIGEWKVLTAFATSGGTDVATRRMSQSFREELSAWEEVGVVSVKSKKDFSKGFTGWGDWLTLSTKGVREIIQIQPTKKGIALAVTPPSADDALLLLRQGKARIVEVVQNELVKKDADYFRVVSGTHDYELVPEVAKVFETRGEITEKARKFRTLLKWDPFDKSWKIVAVDVAKRDANFSTDRVNDSLK